MRRRPRRWRIAGRLRRRPRSTACRCRGRRRRSGGLPGASARSRAAPRRGDQTRTPSADDPVAINPLFEMSTALLPAAWATMSTTIASAWSSPSTIRSTSRTMSRPLSINSARRPPSGDIARLSGEFIGVRNVGPDRIAGGEVVHGHGAGVAILHDRRTRETVITRRAEGRGVDDGVRSDRASVSPVSRSTIRLAPPGSCPRSSHSRYASTAATRPLRSKARTDSQRSSRVESPPGSWMSVADEVVVERRHHREVRTHQWTGREVVPDVAEHFVVLSAVACRRGEPN